MDLVRQHEDCVSALPACASESSLGPWHFVRPGIEDSLNAAAASSVSLNTCTLPSVELSKKATRESRGRTSCTSSSRLPLNCGDRVESPVIFPPGCARLATNPFPTGSLSCAMTMGIVFVAFLAGRVAAGPLVTMPSTLRFISSAASAGRRSRLPSGDRHSMTMFFPSR